MHLAAPEQERLKWRRWRPFRTYAQPLRAPAPTEVLDVREPSSWREHRLGDVHIVDFLAGGRHWEMAVVIIDTDVVITALTESWS
ncbi:hypothetical protein [Nocardiopsis sp. JB363]|uniref:hypothetical protein n=1 Tax=Nocardiopsis sp. JB363 TaxID=1434837 RepID=UPI00117E721B|nr:hypothetical protein [Nocardiopsis sp. JB363]